MLPPLNAAPTRFFKRFLLLHITFGWNCIGLEPFETHLFEKYSHLDLTALDACQLLNHTCRLAKTRRGDALANALPAWFDALGGRFLAGETPPV